MAIDLSARKTALLRRYTTAMANTAPTVERKLKAAAPKDTRELEQSINVSASGLTISVVVAAEHASFTREGTQPHIIRPRKGQYLAFQWDAAPESVRRLPDGRALARQVQHPGTDPNPWYDDTLAEFPDDLETALSRLPTD